MYFILKGEIESFLSQIDIENKYDNVVFGKIKNKQEFQILVNIQTKIGCSCLIRKSSMNLMIFICRILFCSLTFAALFFNDKITRNILQVSALLFLIGEISINSFLYLPMFFWLKSNKAHLISKQRYERDLEENY